MFVDFNCLTGSWPFRPYRATTPVALADILDRESIDLACVSSLEASLLDDPYDVNTALIQESKPIGSIAPIPVLNPRIRRWRDELDERMANPDVRGIKLHPNYHDVELNDDELELLVERVGRSGRLLFIPVRIADERYHHVHMQVPPVSLGAIAALAVSHPECPIVVLNAYRSEIHSIEFPNNLYTDLAAAERYQTLEDLVSHVGIDHLVFGSNTPMFVTRAATLKVLGSHAGESMKDAVANANARRLLGMGASV